MKKLLAITFVLLMNSYSWATVNITDSKVQYTCDGIITTYNYVFQIYEDDDLIVTKTEATSLVETTLVLNVDYSVTGAGGNGGTVELLSADNCGSGFEITITRAVDLLQQIYLEDGFALSMEQLETGYDKAMLIAQDQQEDLSRALLSPKSSDLENIELPNPSPNKSLCWDESGTAITNCDSSTATSTVFDHIGNYDDLADAISDIGSAVTVLVVDIETIIADSTSVTAPKTLYFMIINGGKIKGVVGGGTETFTAFSPEHIIAQPNQIIFGGNLTATFTKPGRLPIVWYATSGDGSSSSRWVGALERAFNEAGGARYTYYAPVGQYQDADTILLDETSDGGYYQIEGDGPQQTKFYFSQTDDSSLLKLQRNGGAATLTSIGIRGIGFFGGSTATGAAIEAIDFSWFTLDDCDFFDWDADTVTSKGVWTKGKEFFFARNIRGTGTLKLFHIDKNPNLASIDADHFSFENIYHSPQEDDNGITYYLEDTALTGDILVYEMKIKNSSTAKGKYGLYWNLTAATLSPGGISIDGMRKEQGDDINKDTWAIYIDAGGTQQPERLTLKNVRSSNRDNGIFINSGNIVTLENCFSAAGAGFTAYDIDAVRSLTFNGNFAQSTATRTIGTSLTMMMGDDLDTETPIFGHWTAAKVRTKFGRPVVKSSFALTFAHPVATSANDGDIQTVTATDATTFTMSNPLGGIDGQEIQIIIYNSSGGAMGNITWGANWKFDGGVDPTEPTNGNRTTVSFTRASSSAWVETGRAEDTN